MSLAPSDAKAERTVYLNLDPTTLNSDNEQDPTTDSFSSTGFNPGPISGWPELSEAQRSQLLFWLKEATAPFDIVYTFDRPAAAGYDMVVFGTAADNTAIFDGPGCSAPISLADCEDAAGPNISFMFYGCLAAGQQDDMRRVAFSTLVATGFSWGLENEDSNGQIMGSYSVFGLEYGNVCVPVVDGSCTHTGCANNLQNAAADLTALVGARVDDGPPVVEILSPTDLEDVDPNFDIVANVSDKYGGVDVVLEIVEAKQMIDQPEPPYEWSLSKVPPGAWTIRVTATDADANVTTEEVVVCVDWENCPEGPAGTTTGASTGAADDTTTTGEPPDDTGTPEPASTSSSSTTAAETGAAAEATGDNPLDPTTPLDPASFGGPSSGCHCNAAPEPTSAAWLLVLLGGLVRRRR